MRDPKHHADKHAADHEPLGETRPAPVRKRSKARLRGKQHADQEHDRENLDQTQEHVTEDATTAPQGEALAIIGAQLGDSVRAFRRTRDPQHQADIARLTELLMETPVRTHADLLALSSVTWAVLSVPFDQPLPGFPPVDAREAILAAAPVLNRAIAALEADTGIGAEAFTGADLPAVN